MGNSAIEAAASPAQEALRIELWFDLVCPFCYIGRRRLQRAVADSGSNVRIAYRAFQLSPDAPSQSSENLSQVLSQRFGITVAQAREANAQVTEIARSWQLDFDLESARWANTFDAHRLMKLAAEHQREDAMVETLYSAFFVEGERIGDLANLKRLGVRAGIPSDAIDRLENREAFASEVAEDREEARKAGVSAVPSYRIGGDLLVADQLTPQAIRRMAAAHRATAQ